MTGPGTFCRDSTKEGLSPEDDFLLILTDLSPISLFLASRIKFPSRIEPPGYPATIKYKETHSVISENQPFNLVEPNEGGKERKHFFPVRFCL